jgi:hypothetical protein
MLGDEDDKRIKEAADHYHPEYDDSAWEKMLQLLDLHLPVEEERKRNFFFTLLLLSVGCVLLLMSVYFWQNNKSKATLNLLSTKQTEKLNVSNGTSDPKNITQQPSAETKNITAIRTEKIAVEKHTGNSETKNSVKTETVSSFFNSKNKKVDDDVENGLPAKQNDEFNQKEIETTNTKDVNQVETAVQKNTITATNDNTDIEISSNQQKTVEQHDIEKKEKVNVQNSSKQTNKAKNYFANNFAVSISAGPDISNVYRNKIGKLTLEYGAGIGYAISQKFSVRTGFYFSKKIYSVGPEDYKVPAGSMGNYEYLENVDANCKVYEIPLKLDYNFGKTKNHSWFVSGGISSYLMKKENYEYYFKTPTGQIYDKDWSISNKNKHFFSVLAISGGYQYSLNKQFSIIAEPYVNLPLTGIGAGKVRLKSGGILFTIKVKPFQKGR